MAGTSRNSHRRAHFGLRVNRARRVVTLGVMLAAAWVTPAAAQKDPFIEHLIGFHSQLAGTYGDEGAAATAHLDAMAASLAAWDEAIQRTESAFAPLMETASPAERFKIRTTLAGLYLERGRLADALREVDGALALDGTRAAPHLVRGFLLAAVGRDDAAAEAWAQAWTREPANAFAAYLTAARTAAPADPIALTPALKAVLDAAGQPRVAGTRPFVQLALVDDEAATRPVFSPVRYAAGFELIARGDYRNAVARFREAAARDPLVAGRGLPEPFTRGTASLRAGKVDEAIAQLEAAVAESPAASEPHRVLGSAYAAAGNHAQSVTHLEAAARIAPADERTRVALGRELAAAGRWADAITSLRETILAQPESGEARWALADTYLSLERVAEALRESEAAASLTVLAGKSHVHWRVAELRHSLQDFPGVITALTDRMRLRPNAAIAHKDLGLAYVRTGAQHEALAELAVSLLLGPDDAETLGAIGQMHLTAGRLADAEPVLRRATAIRPDLAQARYALGQTLVRLGRHDEAKAELAAFQQLRAEMLDRQRRTFDREVLTREAELQARDGHLDAAVATWDELIAREPDDPAHRRGLAAALVAAGRLTQAVPHLERAAALGAPPDVYRQLADVYTRLGRTDDSARATATYERLRRGADTERAR